jgi:ribosome-binding protein aMBF1 (putative translation factor)
MATKVKREPVLKPLNPTTERLGQQFRAIREMRGLGLRPLASMISITPFCIRRHEAGSMMFRTDDLIRAAEALNVNPCDLTEPASDIDDLLARVAKRRRKPNG